MTQKKITSPLGDASPTSAQQTQVSDRATLEAHIQELTQRIAKGKVMIQEYQQENGTNNFKYLQHLKKLQKELTQAQQQLNELSSRQISFQSSIYKKAIMAFQELVTLNLKKEYHTPRYREQEEMVRKYIREHEDLFSILYHLYD